MTEQRSDTPNTRYSISVKTKARKAVRRVQTMTTTNDKPYSVGLFCSHPDEDNDDCSTGADYDTREEAIAAADNWRAEFPHSAHEATHVMVDGPDIHDVRQVASDAEIAKRKRQREADDRAWRREIANEAGMLHGADAYNDAMGWD